MTGDYQQVAVPYRSVDDEEEEKEKETGEARLI